MILNDAVYDDILEKVLDQNQALVKMATILKLLLRKMLKRDKLIYSRFLLMQMWF